MPLPEDAEKPLWPVHIGEAARLSGVSAKMVRHYESLGLLPGVGRTESGYRLYTEADVHSLKFVRRCRDLGFSMADIASLVDLWHDRGRASASVLQIARRHRDALNARIAQLQAMQRTLDHLMAGCHGDQRPDCPILDDLAGHPQPASNCCGPTQ
jgi:Cu(I)-responsive transcriptional regulator